MAKTKLRIGILFGGRSGEHEISLLSAASILKAIDRKKYEIVALGITKQGQWVRDGEAQRLLTGSPAPPSLVSGRDVPDEDVPSDDAELAIAGAVIRSGEPLSIPAPKPHLTRSFQTIDLITTGDRAIAPTASQWNALDVDAVFPVLHGTFGEDGTIQGLLELADVAYVGSGVLGSSVSMDKAVMKRLFAAAGLAQTPHLAMLRSHWKTDPKHCTKLIESSLQYPVFVKPANLGSSVGISKVHGRGELVAAMELAASFDRKLVIEQGVCGQGYAVPGAKPRELEVAVLGNDAPEASVVGEIVPGAEFYDYNAKYHSDASVPIIPAKLSKSEEKQVRAMAIAAFRACECSGLARVDFLMEPKQKGQPARIFLNEINTMPGFTQISMYPKLWAASGLPYKKLIDRLIELAVERQKEKSQTSFSRE